MDAKETQTDPVSECIIQFGLENGKFEFHIMPMP